MPRKKNKVVGFILCDIQNNKEPSKHYQPSASAKNSYLN